EGRGDGGDQGHGRGDDQRPPPWAHRATLYGFIVRPDAARLWPTHARRVSRHGREVRVRLPRGQPGDEEPARGEGGESGRDDQHGAAGAAWVQGGLGGLEGLAGGR